MAEGDVHYASVVFKTNKHAPPEAKKHEETVYDEVKVQSQQGPTAEQSGDANDSKANNVRHHQRLACCLGIVCVILLLGIIAVVVYLTTLSHESEQNQLKENQTTQHLLATIHNLTDLNSRLNSESENLRRDHENLTVQFDNLTRASAVLEHKISNLTADNQNLTAQNQNLTAQNQRLETEKNNLTERIQDMETKWNELNISRAQWSVDAYCPTNKNRRCGPCRPGWLDFQSDCFASKNVERPRRRSWDGARADCKEESSDLVVIDNDNEKEFVSRNSYDSSGTTGFWIGLRVKDGKWKWVDGRDLAETSWMDQPATEGQCAISVRNEGWKSVNCGERQQWICEQKGLTI